MRYTIMVLTFLASLLCAVIVEAQAVPDYAANMALLRARWEAASRAAATPVHTTPDDARQALDTVPPPYIAAPMPQVIMGGGVWSPGALQQTSRSVAGAVDMLSRAAQQSACAEVGCTSRVNNIGKALDYGRGPQGQRVWTAAECRSCPTCCSTSTAVVQREQGQGSYYSAAKGGSQSASTGTPVDPVRLAKTAADAAGHLADVLSGKTVLGR